MTATSFLLILIGIFIILNSGNFVKVLKGEATINFLKPKSTDTFTPVPPGPTTSVH